MKICGIITEYNPMHNGHIYHIQKAKKTTNCDYIVCIMSGNFTQRGIPSLLDKWTKTEIALKNGVDLVIELPSIYSISSAEFFSYGAISLLNNLNVINTVCFGSEEGDINILKQIAYILVAEPNDYKLLLKKYLNLGMNYPTSRNEALKEYIKTHKKGINNTNINNILNNSNNILGIEYCKSLLKLNSTIKPYTIQRKGNNYNDLNISSDLCSATSIRNHLKNKNKIEDLKKVLPKYTYEEILNLNDYFEFPFEESMFPYIKYKILTNEESLKKIPDISEGLDRKIYNELKNSKNYNELILNIKSKRYTYTRLSRILCQVFIGFDLFNSPLMRSTPCEYIRVLGFNHNGRKILKNIKTNSSIPIINKLPKTLNQSLKLDLQTTRAYSILNKKINPMDDYYISPIFYKY